MIPVFRLLFGCGLGIKRALEQDGVFQLDMVVQIINELAQLFVELAPAAAGVFRRGQVVGECEQLADGLFVFAVLVHHHADGHGGAAAGALFDHRKQHALFFHHVVA